MLPYHFYLVIHYIRRSRLALFSLSYDNVTRQRAFLFFQHLVRRSKRNGWLNSISETRFTVKKLTERFQIKCLCSFIADTLSEFSECCPRAGMLFPGSFNLLSYFYRIFHQKKNAANYNALRFIVFKISIFKSRNYSNTFATIGNFLTSCMFCKIYP